MSRARKRKAPPFFETVVHHLQPPPGLVGLSVGYESGQWRYERLVNYALSQLPSFALTYRERQNLDQHDAVELVTKAAKSLYLTPKYNNRGEFGELLLHTVLQDYFNTEPAISKIFFKDSPNDTVKGFDSVHISYSEETQDLELWLGESKFFSDIKQAIRSSVTSLLTFCNSSNLRNEFVAIANKLDPETPNYDELITLFHENTSLDTIFGRLSIPILLTYNSITVRRFSESTDQYKEEIRDEIRRHYGDFCRCDLPRKLIVHLLLLPLMDKDTLAEYFDRRLKQLGGT